MSSTTPACRSASTQPPSALQGRKERIVVPAQHEESLGLLHVPDQLVVVAVVAVVDVAGALAQLALPHRPLGGVGIGDRKFDGDLSPNGKFQVELARAVLRVLPPGPSHAG